MHCLRTKPELEPEPEPEPELQDISGPNAVSIHVSGSDSTLGCDVAGWACLTWLGNIFRRQSLRILEMFLKCLRQ